MPAPLSFGFLVFPDIQQLDLTGPYEIASVLDRPKEVHLLWHDLRPVRSTTGLAFTPTRTFADCPPLDVVCVPGGIGVNALLRDEAVLAFLRAQARSARYVTSVCTGSLVLGAAGLLRGKRATSHWLARDLLAGFGAVPTQGRVVRDGKIITAGGVTAGIDFALTIIAELCGDEAAQACQLQLEYAPAPPFDAGTPETAPKGVVAKLKAGGAAVREQRSAFASGWAARNPA
ncbi:DJ-1/PfpI family protein [Lichenibacterium minor]|uniref:DJ-1/PfpI family protein n=1 Tax=Lichenibacterium minor TaxID=2316528 RepID=A0A4Q2U9F8_9HYPH|nr:DJ-1/PfpI family protein [Lichenibacterium minor]RYC33092.1 DJ-1/PfpI family protein [Lichenibacterium minor]